MKGEKLVSDKDVKKMRFDSVQQYFEMFAPDLVSALNSSSSFWESIRKNEIPNEDLGWYIFVQLRDPGRWGSTDFAGLELAAARLMGVLPFPDEREQNQGILTEQQLLMVPLKSWFDDKGYGDHVILSSNIQVAQKEPGVYRIRVVVDHQLASKTYNLEIDMRPEEPLVTEID